MRGGGRRLRQAAAVRSPGARLRPGRSAAVAGGAALTAACAGGRSRKNIRDAKKAQASDINERIANWRDKNGKQTVSRAEVSRHNRQVLIPARAAVRVLLAACAGAGRRACKLTERLVVQNDAWVIVDGVVYDVTGFIQEHPGGPELLAKRAGQDVTETFRSRPRPRARGLGRSPAAALLRCPEECGRAHAYTCAHACKQGSRALTDGLLHTVGNVCGRPTTDREACT